MTICTCHTSLSLYAKDQENFSKMYGFFARILRKLFHEGYSEDTFTNYSFGTQHPVFSYRNKASLFSIDAFNQGVYAVAEGTPLYISKSEKEPKVIFDYKTNQLACGSVHQLAAQKLGFSRGYTLAEMAVAKWVFSRGGGDPKLVIKVSEQAGSGPQKSLTLPKLKSFLLALEMHDEPLSTAIVIESIFSVESTLEILLAHLNDIPAHGHPGANQVAIHLNDFLKNME